MIVVKNKEAIRRMTRAGSLLAEIFTELQSFICQGMTTIEIDTYISQALKSRNMISMTKGYMGYQHASCISVNEVVVHGIPSEQCRLVEGDLVKVDVCASWRGYCADMARPFYIGKMVPDTIKHFITTAQRALDAGIAQAVVGSRLTNISAAVQQEVESQGYSVIRDFAGHGIGKRMHEDPEILNYGKPGKGPIMQSGMTFAIEPMIAVGKYDVFVTEDEWTVKTVDGSLAMHVEDTVLVTEDGPIILTRNV